MTDLKKKAEDFVNRIMMPSGTQRPSKEMVLAFLKEEMGAELSRIEEREHEAFVCRNRGVEIMGDFYPGKNEKVCVILAHGFAQNRYIMFPQMKLFWDMGFCTVWFDQRAFGVSKEKYCTFGQEEAGDVVRLIRWVKERCGKETKIVLFGASMGAATVMNALRYTDEIDYVIEDCGFSDVGAGLRDIYAGQNGGEQNPYVLPEFESRLEGLGASGKENIPLEAVRGSNVPVCVIHGLEDSVISAKEAERIYAVCRNPMSRMELFEGKEHALSVTDEKRYDRVLRGFLEKII